MIFANYSRKGNSMEREQKLFRYAKESKIKAAFYFGWLKVSTWYMLAKRDFKAKKYASAIYCSLFCLLAPVSILGYVVFYLKNA